MVQGHTAAQAEEGTGAESAAHQRPDRRHRRRNVWKIISSGSSGTRSARARARVCVFVCGSGGWGPVCEYALEQRGTPGEKDGPAPLSVRFASQADLVAGRGEHR